MLEEGSRDRAVAVELLDLLDVDHPAQRLLDKEEELLPGSVLDYQGDVRIRSMFSYGSVTGSQENERF